MRRRRNPQTFYVHDRYMGGFVDFASLLPAISYAKRKMACDADDMADCIFVDQNETMVPLSKARPHLVKRIAAAVHALVRRKNPMHRSSSRRRSSKSAIRRERRKYTSLSKADHQHIQRQETADISRFSRWNPRKAAGRRNPGHPAYGQWLFKLGFPMNDPIIELATVWAYGQDAGAGLLSQAKHSAERWMESRDKKLRSAAKAVYNKLAGMVGAASAKERERGYKYAPYSLSTRKSNPRRRTRRNARPGENEIPTVKIARGGSRGRSNPRSKADLLVLHDMRAKRKSLDVLGDIELALRGRELSPVVARMARKYLKKYGKRSSRSRR